MEPKKEKNKVWSVFGGEYHLTSVPDQDLLDNVVYVLHQNPNSGAMWLTKESDDFSFDYKLYGLETALVDRVLKTYANTTSGNLGILLNGVKGTGKTVTSKIIANKLKQPVVIVSNRFPGAAEYLNSIPQNITIFVDEYEKIFGDKKDLLTIMDGALNSNFRRVFLLTTNNLYVEENMIQRPSRIRYLKKFSDLAPSVVEEIIDDILLHTEFKEDLMSFVTSLELITVDIIKSILNEVNMHKESPYAFSDVFNVRMITGKYKVYTVNEEGAETMVATNAKVYPRPKFNDDYVGSWLTVNGNYVGKVLTIKGENLLTVGKYKNGDTEQLPYEVFTVKVEETFGYHSNYAFSGTANLNSASNIEDSPFFMNIEDDEEDYDEVESAPQNIGHQL